MKRFLVFLFIILMSGIALADSLYINYTVPKQAVRADFHLKWVDYWLPRDCFLTDTVALKITGETYVREIKLGVWIYSIGYLGCKTQTGWAKVYGTFQISPDCTLTEERVASWLVVNTIRCKIKGVDI